MFEKLTVEEYCEKLAGKQPTPGGGSGLAVVGAIACSLIEMSVNVTVAGLSETDERYAYLQAEENSVKRAKACMYRLADDDAESYAKIVAARKLPKNSEEEIKARTAAMQKAFHQATLVPLQLMQLSLDVIKKANVRIAEYVSKYVKSDCEIGVNLLKTVIKNSLFNVRANTCCIKDQKLKSTLDRQADEIVKEVNVML